MDKGFTRDVLRFDERRDGLTRLDTPVREQILARVGVGEPYFDLHDIRFSRERLLATTRATFVPSKEIGPMQVAEVCRHAGVAGASIVAWRQRDGIKRYCLLESVVLRAQPSSAAYGTPVDFSAQIVALGDRTAQTAVNVSVNGSAFAELELSYRVFKGDDFKITFQDKFRKMAPYVRPIWTLLNTPLVREGTSMVRTLSVHPASCQGHFGAYPVLPAALVAGEFVNQAASRLNGGYRCTELSLTLEEQCWANDKVKVSSYPAQRGEASLSFKGHVSRDRQRLIAASVSIASA